MRCVGPIRHSFNRLVTGFVADRVDLITVREDASRRTFWELGVNRPPIRVTADQVLPPGGSGFGLKLFLIQRGFPR